MRACLVTLLPEDMHRNAFDGLLVPEVVCLRVLPSMALEPGADTAMPGSKSTEVGCAASLCHLRLLEREVLDGGHWYIEWMYVDWDVVGCALLEKQFASHSSPPPRAPNH